LGLVGFFFWLSNIVLCWLMLRGVDVAPVPAPVKEAANSKPPKVPLPTDSWEDIKEINRTLWYGYLGGLVCMFFLSRSYLPLLIIHLALVVAVYQLARRANTAVVRVQFADRWGRLLMFSMAVAIGLALVTKVLS
jgi:hypothetical protein